MSAFGKKFKSAREAKGISLDQIAQETRISTRFLRAIEQETFDTLPGGVFNRGFIRSYAMKVGLDPNAAVAEYRDLTAEPDVEEPPPLQTVSMERREKHVVPIAIGGLVVLIVLFYVFARDSAPVIEAARETPSAAARAGRVTAPPPAPASIARDVPVRAAEPAPPVGGRVSVHLQVHDPTWVLITADGREVLGGVILNPGTNRRYTAREALELTIGNAAGLTLSINGRQVPNLGRSGQVRVLTITPDNADNFLGS